jgi:hypothetical protein
LDTQREIKVIARARLHEQQPSTEKKKGERDPPRKNQAGRPETGDQRMQCFHSMSLHVFHRSN